MKRLILPFLMFLLTAANSYATGHFFPKNNAENTILLCPAPTGLSVIDITATSAKLKWHAVSDALGGYQVQIRVAGTSIWATLPTTTNSLLVQSLLPNTSYQWRVKSICDPGGAGGDFSDILNFMTLQTASNCTKPVDLSTTNITSNSAQLNWHPVAGAISYEVQIRVGTSTNYTSFAVAAPPFIAQNLTPNTVHHWRVRAICDANTVSDWSIEKEFKTLEAGGLDCPKPTGLHATNITQNSVQLSWTGSNSALGYQIDYQPVGATTWTTVYATPPSTTVFVGNLTPSTGYLWRVRAKCDGSIFSDWAGPEDFKTLASTLDCPHPFDLVATNITANSAQLSWAPVVGALGYEVNYALAGTANWQSVFVTNVTTSVTVNNLAPLTAYIWRVRAKCDGSIFSDWSAVKEFKTLENTNTCPKPVDLAATNITQTSVQFSWAAVAGALGYEVNYAVGGTSNWVSVFVAAPNSSVIINNLLPGTNYRWRVRTKCDGQVFSDWSPVHEFKTLGNAADCVAPHEFAVKNLTHHSALLVWNKVPGAIGYEIQVRKIGTTDWLTFTVFGNPPIPQFQAGNLIPEMDYEWRVRSICDPAQNSDWGSTQHFMTLPEPGPGMPCAVPTDFHVDVVTHFSAKFSWTATPGAFSYQITYRAVNSTIWKTINVTGNPVPNMFLLLNLAPNTHYEAKIRAHCGTDTNSDWSPVVTFTTMAAPPCSTPTDLQSNDITFFSAKLSWSAVPGATIYRVRYRKFGTQNWKLKTITGAPPATMTTVSPLPASSTIEWQVRAICGPGSEGDWSPLATFQTPATPPCDAPVNITVSNLTATSAQFSWTGPAGSISYKIRYRKIVNGQPGPWKVKNITGTPPATTTSVDGLSPESSYEVQGRTICGPASQSVWSVATAFVTPPQLQGPNGPEDLLTKKTTWGGAAISPNPTADLANYRFESSEEGEGQLQVFDLNGKIVFSAQLVVNQGFNEVEFSLGEVPPGIYLLRLQGEKQVLTEKIQVVR